VMVKRYKDLLERGALDSYRAGLALEGSSEKTYYGDLADIATTLKDGAGKFQAMVRWVAERD
jgi:hypothetical protein